MSMVRLWIQHASSHSTDTLIARYGSKEVAEKVAKEIKALASRWEKKHKDSSEQITETGVVGRGTVYSIITYPCESIERAWAIATAHSPTDIRRCYETERFDILVKGVKTPAEAKKRLNDFVRVHGTRKTLFNMDKTVITDAEYDEKVGGVWISGETEDYDMCWNHEGMVHFKRLGALTVEMVKQEGWLDVNELWSCKDADAEDKKLLERGRRETRKTRVSSD